MTSASRLAVVWVLLVAVGCRARPEPSRDHGPPPASSTVDASSECSSLRAKICEQYGPASEECELVTEQVAGFSPTRCGTMLERYPEMAESAAALVEGRRALTAREQNLTHGPAPSLGAPNAPITMVFFGDFSSPACARGALLAQAIRNLYADRVRLVFRQFPLTSNPQAALAAEASLAAHAQGKFWRYYELLYGNQHAQDREALVRYAKEAGLEVNAFARALDQHVHAADVAQDRELGRKLGVIDLPALFVNGRRVEFPYGELELRRLLEQTP